jgi:hypothetical protein
MSTNISMVIIEEISNEINKKLIEYNIENDVVVGNATISGYNSTCIDICLVDSEYFSDIIGIQVNTNVAQVILDYSTVIEESNEQHPTRIFEFIDPEFIQKTATAVAGIMMSKISLRKDPPERKIDVFDR